MRAARRSWWVNTGLYQVADGERNSKRTGRQGRDARIASEQATRDCRWFRKRPSMTRALLIPLAVLLCLLPGRGATAPERPPTLVLRPFGQRMAERYTTRDGL